MDTKGHISYDSTYVRYGYGAVVKGERGVVVNGYRVPIVDDDSILEMDGWMVAQQCKCS